MTQAQIDEMLSILKQNGNKDIEYKEIQYHLLICRYCNKIIESSSLDMHYLMTNTKCDISKYRHVYVSEEWLKNRKANPYIVGWRCTYKINPEPRSKMVPSVKQSNKVKNSKKEGIE